MRRKQNAWLQTTIDFDADPVPHKFECAWNDNWVWASDGGKSYQSPDTETLQAYRRLLRK